jgi:hypothetical protein
MVIGRGKRIEAEIRQFLAAHGKDISFGQPEFWHARRPYPVRFDPAQQPTNVVFSNVSLRVSGEELGERIFFVPATSAYVFDAKNQLKISADSDRLGNLVYVLRIGLPTQTQLERPVVRIGVNGNLIMPKDLMSPLKISKTERPSSNEIAIVGDTNGDKLVLFGYAKEARLSDGKTEVAPTIHEVSPNLAGFEERMPHELHGAAWIPRTQEGTEQICLRLMAHMNSGDWNINAVAITFLD